jgi:EamA-like transporter family.
MIYILIFLCSVFISSISQVLLKSSANRQYRKGLQEYLNPRVVAAYGMFFVATLVTIVAYRYVPLSMGGILEAAGYIFVAVLSYIFLHEKIGKRKMAGLLIILGGILVFNIGA